MPFTDDTGPGVESARTATRVLVRLTRCRLKCLATLLSLHQLAICQPPVLTAQAPDRSVIRATVIDSRTNLPIEGLSVTAFMVGGPGQISKPTDRMGRAVFDDVTVGKWKLMTTAERGYLPTSTNIDLKSESGTIAVKVVKTSRVSGSVVDSDARAVKDANVFMFGYLYRDGIPGIGAFLVAVTDANGKFAFPYGASEGKYYFLIEPKDLEIQHRPLKPDGTSNFKDKEAKEGLGRAFYPDAPQLDAAVPMSIRAGQDIEDLRIVVHRTLTTCLVTVVDSLRNSATAFVALSELIPQSQFRIASGAVPTGSEIEVCGVSPGMLGISVTSEGKEPSYGRDAILATTKTTMRVPEIPLHRPRKVMGRIILVGSEKLTDALRSSTGVTLHPTDRLQAAFEKLTAGAIDPSGRFEIPSVLPDSYHLSIRGLTSGYYVRSAKLGNIEAYGVPFKAYDAELLIELGDDGPTLQGSVVDRDGKPVADAVVVLMRPGLKSPFKANEIRAARVAADGKFTISGFPPGEYRVEAFVDVPVGMAEDPTKIPMESAGSKRVAFQARDRITLTLSNPASFQMPE